VVAAHSRSDLAVEPVDLTADRHPGFEQRQPDGDAMVALRRPLTGTHIHLIPESMKVDVFEGFAWRRECAVADGCQRRGRGFDGGGGEIARGLQRR
jgi:hypothetical protein